MRGQVLLAAIFAAATISAAEPAAAEQYRSYHDEHVAREQQCAAERQNGAIAGAIIGGIAGAIFGSQVSSRGHRTDGSVLGGVAGAAAGAAIGNGAASENCQTQPRGAYDPYYGQPVPPNQYGQGPYDDDELAGGPYEQSGWNQNRQNSGDCRWGETVTTDPDGFERRESTYMCRGRDGVWRPA